MTRDGAGESLGHAERIDWLRLARSENIGPVTFLALLRRFGGPAAALDALPGLARRGGRQPPIRICSKAAAERELAALAGLGGHLIALCEPAYPAPLAAIADPPPLLALRGDAGLLARESIAVVGARNADRKSVV